MKNGVEMKMYFNFIGIDGSGKDTLSDEIIPYFDNVIEIKEPGGTEAAEQIRELILYPESTYKNIEKVKKVISSLKNPKTIELLKLALEEFNKFSLKSEVYLFAAARNELINDVIIPNRNKYNIIGKRSVACSVAYQGYARKFGPEFVWDINRSFMNENSFPDFEIFFDVPVELCLKRIRNRDIQNHLDKQSDDFYYEAREGYFKYYKKFAPYPVYVIDCGSKTVDEIKSEVLTILENKNILKPVKQ